MRTHVYGCEVTADVRVQFVEIVPGRDPTTVFVSAMT